ncbi:MAG TPA: RNA polymerase sigma factor [Blastocatellia bacterium]|jgi:RNA polymerase sigma-70 factor (ECF subfamily)|nr:RNA polymerase sigma factor [Blastocatellia bacterium]
MAIEKQEILRVLLAQTGDRVALDELFKTIENPLYRYILSLVREPAIAEDVLQEVLLLIYKKLYWLKQPELFRPWAYRIASREAFRALRKERRWSEQVRDETVLEAIPAPAPETFEPDLIERLPDLLDLVSPSNRAVLVLHYLHEMSLREVADVLGLPAGTVKSRLFYGLSTLRKNLQSCEPGRDFAKGGRSD